MKQKKKGIVALLSPKNFGQYPLWLCSLSPGSAGDVEGQPIDDMGTDGDKQKTTLLNTGIWGSGATTKQAGFIAQNRQLEHKVQSFGGKKCLYAHAYYTEDKFWAIYNKPGYDALRGKYYAQHLPTLYDNVRVRLEDLPRAHRGEFESGWKGFVKRALWDVWPFRGLYGVYKAWRGGDHLLQKEDHNK